MSPDVAVAMLPLPLLLHQSGQDGDCLPGSFKARRLLLLANWAGSLGLPRIQGLSFVSRDFQERDMYKHTYISI